MQYSCGGPRGYRELKFNPQAALRLPPLFSKDRLGLPAEFYFPDMLEQTHHKVEKRFEKLSQGRISYLYKGGEGPAIVLLHGAGNSAESFARLLEVLPGPCIAPNFFCHGDSDAVEHTQISQLAGDVADLLKAIGYQDALVVGNAMGADVALAMALDRPEMVKAVVNLNGGGLELAHSFVVKLLLVPPFSCMIFNRFYGVGFWASHQEGLLRNEAVRKNSGFKQRVAFLKSSQRLQNLRLTMLHLEEGRRLLDSRLDQITKPVLVLYGNRDPEFTESYGRNVARAVRGSFELLDGLGHFPHEDDPDQVAARLVDFLNSL